LTLYFYQSTLKDTIHWKHYENYLKKLKICRKYWLQGKLLFSILISQ
jgi:hypothetical protein